MTSNSPNDPARLAEEAKLWISQVAIAGHRRSPAQTKVAVEALEAFIDRLASLASLAQAGAEEARDALRWRAVKARHGMSMVRLATGGSGYSSHKKDGILDAWADMAAAEVAAFDSEAFRADMNDRIAELEGDAAITATRAGNQGMEP